MNKSSKREPQRKKKSSGKTAGATYYPSPKTITINAKLMAIAKDPKKAEAFLIKAGIIIEAGKLAPEYDD